MGLAYPTTRCGVSLSQWVCSVRQKKRCNRCLDAEFPFIECLSSMIDFFLFLCEEQDSVSRQETPQYCI